MNEITPLYPGLAEVAQIARQGMPDVLRTLEEDIALPGTAGRAARQ